MTPASESDHGWESSEAGGGQSHTIPIDEGDHDSASTGIVLQPSQALNNSSFTSVRHEEGAQTVESQPNNQTETILGESVFSCSGMHKTFLLVSINLFLAIAGICYAASNSQSKEARILLFSSVLCSAVATVLCFSGYLLEGGSRPDLARMMTAGGVIAATCSLGVLTASLLANFQGNSP